MDSPSKSPPAIISFRDSKIAVRENEDLLAVSKSPLSPIPSQRDRGTAPYSTAAGEAIRRRRADKIAVLAQDGEITLDEGGSTAIRIGHGSARPISV